MRWMLSILVVLFSLVLTACGGDGGSGKGGLSVSDGDSDRESNENSVDNATSGMAIEGVAFHNKYSASLNNYTAYPYFLFENGLYTSDHDAITTDMNIEEYRDQNPGKWGEWKQEGGVLQLNDGNGWVEFDYQTVLPPIPDGYSLNGSYSQVSFSGAVGSGATVSAVSELTFSSNGRFVFGSRVSATTGGPFIDDSGFSNVSSDQQGSYSIEGFRLNLYYDNGETQTVSIITDDVSTLNSLWINAQYFRS